MAMAASPLIFVFCARRRRHARTDRHDHRRTTDRAYAATYYVTVRTDRPDRPTDRPDRTDRTTTDRTEPEPYDGTDRTGK